MKIKKQKFWISLSIILNMIFFGTLIVVRADNVPKLSQSPPMENVVIDGIINETEWTNRDWTIFFYLDIDDVGNPPDKDGTNYLYLGEDLNNLYLGLDLCSDQTNNITGEWISLWLNIANRNFSSYSEWSTYLNNGTESLIYDVENDKAWQFFDYGVLYNKTVYLDEYNTEYNAIHGNIEGDIYLFDPFILPYLNISSVQMGPDHVVQVDFSVDVLKWFPVLPGILSSNVERVSFELSTRTNTTITENKIISWYYNGTWDKNDPNQANDINVNTTLLSESFWYNKGNITADRKLNFTLYANHSAPFTIQFDYFTFTAAHYAIRVPHSSVWYPYSSIIDYDMAWGFNTSANNAANHRMFEFRFPKSSLEHYDSDGTIGIIIGGYGTLSFTNSSYWVFSKYIHQFNEEQSKDYYYYNMLGIDFPSGGEATISGYHVLLMIGVIGIYSIFLVKKKMK
ncbi:MAG: hypothetical protein ACFE9X_15180 [Promethearchaeota archaeon]